jgi:hypothetical protein
MQKKEILKALKQACNNTSVKLPKPLDFSIVEDWFTILLPKERTYKNMQDDNNRIAFFKIFRIKRDCRSRKGKMLFIGTKYSSSD